MQVIIGEQILQYENTRQGVTSLLKDIESIQLEHSLIFNHATIDGVDIYNNIEEYLFANSSDITSVTIHLLSKERLEKEIIQSVYEYVTRSISEIEKLSNDMYRGTSPEVWGRFGQLVEGIQWLGQTGSFIGADHSLFLFEREMEELEEALEQQDNVLLGDIMRYEIIPHFEEIAKHLSDFADKEGARNDIN
jgi:hypothetical protein